jgi:hypothetical protein
MLLLLVTRRCAKHELPSYSITHECYESTTSNNLTCYFSPVWVVVAVAAAWAAPNEVEGI